MLWRQIQAEVFGQPVETVQAEEGPASGAALLAGVGAGVWQTIDDACDTVVRTLDLIDSRPKIADLMNDQYQRYRQVYPALRSLRGPVPQLSYV